MRIALLGLLLLAACTVGPRTRPGTGPRTMLRVDNQSFADMTIYVVNSSQRIRLGHAAGLRRTMLRIPDHVLGGARQLSFLADPVGSDRTAVSGQLYVAPGDTVTLLIPPSSTRSANDVGPLRLGP